MEKQMSRQFAEEHMGQFIIFRMPRYEKGDNKPRKEAQIRGVTEDGYVAMTTRVAAQYLLEPMADEDDKKPRGIKGFIPEHYESDFFNMDDIVVAHIMGTHPMLPHIIDGVGAWDTKAPGSDMMTG